MSNYALPTSRVADYFFIAGLNDEHVIPTLDSAKMSQQLSDSESTYYKQQERAVHNLHRPQHRKSVSKQESLLGVLDHVQNVIDHFDKERDLARDNVIAVMDKKNDRPIHRSNTRKWRSLSDSKTDEIKKTIKVPNPLDLKYTPTVLMRYPETDYCKQEPFPAYAAMFCFPKDISLIFEDSPPPEKYHSFTMTDENGSTVYGSCIVFYEKLSHKFQKIMDQTIQEWIEDNIPTSTIEYAKHLKEKIVAERASAEEARRDILSGPQIMEEKMKSCQENIDLYLELLEPVKMAVCSSNDIWVPKSIGLLGRMPWIDLYGDWLRIVLDNVVGVGGYRHDTPLIDIKSAIVNLIDEVPLPPPGRFEIGLTINSRALFFSRPPINQVPILKNFSLYPIFRALSPHLILAVIETLLAEGKVVFLSQNTAMLSLACESFRYLLFPFYWQFVYIPVLPERLLTCLQAPVPYMVGYQGHMSELDEHAPDDACIVNIDSNTMHQSQRSVTLPNRQRRKLQVALEQYAPLHTRCKIPYGVPLSAQHAFPKGKLMLRCNRSKTTDIYVSPAQLPRDSESSSDTNSIWSNTTSFISNPFGMSSNMSVQSSTESNTSCEEDVVPGLPQLPGSAFFSNNVTSTPSLSSPPLRPSVSTSSLGSRLSMPVTAANPGINNSYRKASPQHRSEPPKGHNSSHFSLESKNRMSTFMSKAVLQQENLTSPRISVLTPNLTHEFDPTYPNQLHRRTKHVEGHTMAEIFSSELSRFQGYRCVCGKQVTEEEGSLRVKTFMCCQGCQLVTHDDCTDQILHPCLPSCFDEQKIHNAFIRMFASLLYNYRTGFVDQVENDMSTISASNTTSTGRAKPLYFSKDKFLKHSDKDTREFLSHFSNSQTFNQFVTDRLLKSDQDPEIVVFDEYIKLKLNRSRLKFVKDDTPFMNDDSFRVSQIIWATPPSEHSQFTKETYKRFPTKFNI
ncbi:AEX-3 domain-containing protein [Sporodiniella umbellata]|nr:AEX-3 domain-containing protein [Sporodiniella umbellata]